MQYFLCGHGPPKRSLGWSHGCRVRDARCSVERRSVHTTRKPEEANLFGAGKEIVKPGVSVLLHSTRPIATHGSSAAASVTPEPYRKTHTNICQAATSNTGYMEQVALAFPSIADAHRLRRPFGGASRDTQDSTRACCL